MARGRARWFAGLVAALTLSVIALGSGPAPAEGARRKIYMSAVEYKGGASVTDEAYPPAPEPGTVELAPLGGGYELEAPDETGRWEVATYRFEPGFLVARRGERITLEIAGINGARHEVELESPSGEEREFVVVRGRLTRIRFRADQAGIWVLYCLTHPPGMRAEILVQ